MQKKIRMSVTLFLFIETIFIFVVVSIGRELMEIGLRSLAFTDTGLTIIRIAYILVAMAVALVFHLRLYRYLKKNGYVD